MTTSRRSSLRGRSAISGTAPALVLTALAALVAPCARAIEITLPAETIRLTASPLPGAALATTLCYTCHSAEYTVYQPATSPRTYWKATVVKMQKVFGAPIPDTAIDPLTDYLVQTYGAERPSIATPATADAPSPSNPPAK